MATKYQVAAKLFISRKGEQGSIAFGGGLVELLRRVDETGSIYKAAKDMHMAYSKAWTLINTAEERLGEALIERDGARGSALTAEGKKLLDAYDSVTKDVDDYAAKRFEQALKRL